MNILLFDEFISHFCSVIYPVQRFRMLRNDHLLLLITTDVAKFLRVTLKRVTLPPGASSQRLSLMNKLDELQHSYPQLHWELEDDDPGRNDQPDLVSSMNVLLAQASKKRRFSRACDVLVY